MIPSPLLDDSYGSSVNLGWNLDNDRIRAMFEFIVSVEDLHPAPPDLDFLTCEVGWSLFIVKYLCT